jgi:hypothetical protein
MVLAIFITLFSVSSTHSQPPQQPQTSEQYQAQFARDFPSSPPVVCSNIFSLLTKGESYTFYLSGGVQLPLNDIDKDETKCIVTGQDPANLKFYLDGRHIIAIRSETAPKS